MTCRPVVKRILLNTGLMNDRYRNVIILWLQFEPRGICLKRNEPALKHLQWQGTSKFSVTAGSLYIYMRFFSVLYFVFLCHNCHCWLLLVSYEPTPLLWSCGGELFCASGAPPAADEAASREKAGHLQTGRHNALSSSSPLSGSLLVNCTDCKLKPHKR